MPGLMLDRSVRLTALLVACLLGMTTGLQPLLALVEYPVADETARTERPSERQSPPAKPNPADEAEQPQERSTFSGAGLSDMVDRHERAAKPSPRGTAPADQPILTPVSPAGPSCRPAPRTDIPAIPNNWGQRAHWPCGPPLV